MNILIIDHDPDIRRTLGLALSAFGHKVETIGSAGEAAKKLAEQPCHAAFLDVHTDGPDGLDPLRDLLRLSPKLSVVITTSASSVENAVESIRRGAFDYLPKPFKPSQINQLLDRISKAHQLDPLVAEFENSIAQQEDHFASAEKAVVDMIEIARKSAPSQASILIQGEGGSGKSSLAKYIHRLSSRKKEPFVTVACSGLTPGSFENELFGHAKGAFNGAAASSGGKITEAEGGVLFLHEIGELPLESQPQLLRLIQEHEYERIGESKTRHADLRIIASTTHDLKQAVTAGTFRGDLLYQLDVISIQVPALRERLNDIIPMAEHFLRLFSKQGGKTITGFTSAVRQALKRYSWPGNIRELRNLVERATILASGELVDIEDLPATVTGPHSIHPALGGEFSLQEIEAEHIRQVLAHSGSIQQASATLKIDPTTLLRKRKAYQLSPKNTG